MRGDAVRAPGFLSRPKAWPAGSEIGDDQDRQVTLDFDVVELADDRALAFVGEQNEKNPKETSFLLGDFEALSLLADDPPPGDGAERAAAFRPDAKALAAHVAATRQALIDENRTAIFKTSAETARFLEDEVVAAVKGDEWSDKSFVRTVPLSAEDSWRLPILMGFGGFGDCPPPEVHASILFRWRKFGARPIGMTTHVMVLAIDKPIDNYDAAFEAATEQTYYAPHIVLQGSESVKALARALIDARYWHFWWDRV